MRPSSETLPDLDSRENIERFVDLFYAEILQDERLAPIFLDIAAINLEVHLPHIKNYWCKLLLGESTYSRHTMNIHRQLHGKQALTAPDFQRWLDTFVAVVDGYFSGNCAQRSKRVATSIAANMAKSLQC